MVKAFIIYGKKEGESAAKAVYNYFKSEKGISVFLASPRSPDIKAGKFFKKTIIPRLDRSNVAIVIVTPGLRQSTIAMGEIIRAKALGIDFVPYVRGRTKLPKPLGNLWKPVKFEKGKGGKRSNLENLYSSMWGLLDTRINWAKPRLVKAKKALLTIKLQVKLRGKR